jgi:hypothetical protein
MDGCMYVCMWRLTAGQKALQEKLHKILNNYKLTVVSFLNFQICRNT